MKRSASLSWLLLDRQAHWLPWWQEMVLNWVSSWRTVGPVVVVSADGEHEMTWDVPTDLELQRAELEELLK